MKSEGRNRVQDNRTGEIVREFDTEAEAYAWVLDMSDNFPHRYSAV